MIAGSVLQSINARWHSIQIIKLVFLSLYQKAVGLIGNISYMHSSSMSITHNSTEYRTKHDNSQSLFITSINGSFHLKALIT